jgi:hypothetical protein
MNPRPQKVGSGPGNRPSPAIVVRAIDEGRAAMLQQFVSPEQLLQALRCWVIWLGEIETFGDSPWWGNPART